MKRENGEMRAVASPSTANGRRRLLMAYRYCRVQRNLRWHPDKK
jgi:hypothetical protein